MTDTLKYHLVQTQLTQRHITFALCTTNGLVVHLTPLKKWGLALQHLDQNDKFKRTLHLHYLTGNM